MMARMTVRFITLILFLGSTSALAGAWEFSLGVSFNRTQYTDTNYASTRRWGTSVGYHFTDRSEVELSFTDSVDKTRIVGYEDTTFHDRIYALNWVQTLVGKDAPIQPYVKGGVGQLNRDAEGTYANGIAPASRVDSVTVIAGGGLRLYLTQNFAIRTEVTSYMQGGAVRKWKDNIAATFGISLYL